MVKFSYTTPRKFTVNVRGSFRAAVNVAMEQGSW